MVLTGVVGDSVVLMCVGIVLMVLRGVVCISVIIRCVW